MDVAHLKRSFTLEQVELLSSNVVHSDALLDHYYPDLGQRIDRLMDDDDWCLMVGEGAGIGNKHQLSLAATWAFACLTHLFGHETVSRYLVDFEKPFIGAGVIATREVGLFIPGHRRISLSAWMGTFLAAYAIHRHDMIEDGRESVDVSFLMVVIDAFLNREVADGRIRRRARAHAQKIAWSSAVAAEDGICFDKPPSQH